MHGFRILDQAEAFLYDDNAGFSSGQNGLIGSTIPTFFTAEEKPKLGNEGTTRWKAGSALLPVNKGMSLVASRKLPGPAEPTLLLLLQSR